MCSLLCCIVLYCNSLLWQARNNKKNITLYVARNRASHTRAVAAFDVALGRFSGDKHFRPMFARRLRLG